MSSLEYKRFSHTITWVCLVIMGCLLVTIKLAQIYEVMWLLNAAAYATLPVVIAILVRSYQFNAWLERDMPELVTEAVRKRQAEEDAEEARHNEPTDTLGKQWGMAPSRTPATDAAQVDASYAQARNFDRFH